MENQFDQYVGLHKIFMMELSALSVNKINPIPEWFSSHIIKMPNQCICTTPIEYEHHIVNRLNKNTCIVGSDCVEYIGINFELKCTKCNAMLSNKVHRVHTNKLVCPKCNREEKKLFVQQANYILYDWNGPWNRKTFKTVVECEEWVIKILNSNRTSVSLEAFKSYAGKIYDFEYKT